MTIYQLFTGKSKSEIEQEFQGKGYGDLKQTLAEVVIEGLRPVQEHYKELTSDPDQLEATLKEGADRIRPLANATLKRAQEKIGVR